MKTHIHSRVMLQAAFVACSLLTVATTYAASPQDYKWTAPVKAGTTTSETARLPLSATVIVKVRAGFPDLRLYDGQGKETPYVIYEDITPAVPEKTLSLAVKEFVETDTADQFVVDKFQRSEKIDSIEVVTSNRDFRKTVLVEGSTDRQSWTSLTEDAIFDYSSRVNLRKTTLPLTATDFQFLRITISKDTPAPKETDAVHLQYRDLVFSANGSQSAPFRVDGFTAHSGGRKQDLCITDGVTIYDPTATQDEQGNTFITLGELHLPVSSISLTVAETYFSRPVEVQISDTGKEDTYRTFFHGVIHRIPGAAKAGLELDVDTQQAPLIRLLVRNGDNPPLTIRSARLIWNRRVLYFHPRPEETYSLYFGNKDVTSPSYETAQLISNDALALRVLPEWTIGPVQNNAAFSPAWGKAEREEFQSWILNTLVVLLLVGLGVWGVTILKRLPDNQ